MDPRPLDAAGGLHLGGEEAAHGGGVESSQLPGSHNRFEDRRLALRVINGDVPRVLIPGDVRCEGEALLGEGRQLTLRPGAAGQQGEGGDEGVADSHDKAFFNTMR